MKKPFMIIRTLPAALMLFISCEESPESTDTVKPDCGVNTGVSCSVNGGDGFVLPVKNRGGKTVTGCRYGNTAYIAGARITVRRDMTLRTVVPPVVISSGKSVDKKLVDAGPHTLFPKTILRDSEAGTSTERAGIRKMKSPSPKILS